MNMTEIHNVLATAEEKDVVWSANWAFIQWKGTTVCMDVHCECGHIGHICGVDFAYYWKCPECHTGYKVGTIIRIIPLTVEQSLVVEKHTCGFTKEDE